MFISCLCVLELCLEKAPRCGEETRRDKLDDLLHLLVLVPARDFVFLSSPARVSFSC